MQTNTMSWEGEQALSCWPLQPFTSTELLQYSFLFVDASWTVFDTEEIPVVVRYWTTSGDISVTVSHQGQTLTATVTAAELAIGQRILRYYRAGTLIGTLELGDAVLYNSPTVVEFNISLHPGTVRRISSQSGVLSLDGVFGQLTWEGNDPVFFSTCSGQCVDAEDQQSITISAVPGWYIDTTLLTSTPILRSINQVAPFNNSLFINDNEVVKVTPQSNSLQFSLVGENSRLQNTQVFSTISS